MLIQELDIILGEDVIGVSGQVPRSHLEAGVAHLTESLGDEFGDGGEEDAVVNGATLLSSEFDFSLAVDIGKFDVGDLLVAIVIIDTVGLIDQVEGGAPLLVAPSISVYQSTVLVLVVLNVHFEILGDDGHGVLSLNT